MAKRPRGGAEVASAHVRKRVKVIHEAPTSEEIHTTRQLQGLLAFDQDLQRARHGIQSLKTFLDTLIAALSPDPDRLAILEHYLTASAPVNPVKTTDEDGNVEEPPLILGDVLETWSYAAQMRNDNLLSAVPVILALVLKLISSPACMHLLSLGNKLGRTLLQKRQLDLLARNLIADKSQEFIISPTLRLLREMMIFDGGVLAKAVFRARASTFKALARNMGVRFHGEGVEDVKRTSVRTNAVRFCLSALKYLHTEAKTELISMRDIPSGLVKNLKDDPPYLVVELLETLRDSVVRDGKLSVFVKGRIMNGFVLGRLVGLGGYEHEVEGQPGKEEIRRRVIECVTEVCTTVDGGVLKRDTGLYPQGVDPNAVPETDGTEQRDADNDAVDPGLEGIAWFNKFKTEVPVRNVILAEILQGLRPWVKPSDADLMLAIFGAAPELVAPFFLTKQDFSFEPKLSATWIGYSALLHRVIELPLPRYFGHKSRYARLPPPTSILVDNILPLPLTQKILTKCLLQQSELVPFVVVRMLVLALQKLQSALAMHREAAEQDNKELWMGASQRLLDEFSQRAPGMKDVMSAYRKASENDLLQREAGSRAMRLYYEVVPQMALALNFDISPILAAVLKKLEQHGDEPRDCALRTLELEHLLTMAGYSPDMKWFAKGGGAKHTPFVALLQLLASSTSILAPERLQEVLARVAVDAEVFTPSQQPDGVVRLLASIQAASESGPIEKIWEFLDQCLLKIQTNPIKYMGVLVDLGIDVDSADVDQLMAAMIEQLPYALKGADADTKSLLSRFIGGYLASQDLEGHGDEDVHDKIADAVNAIFHDALAGLKLAEVDIKQYFPPTTAIESPHMVNGDASATDSAESTARLLAKAASILAVPFPPPTEKDNDALTRWQSKDAADFVEEGSIAALTALLASEHPSIRREALTSLAKMASKLRESKYDEKEQVWVLLAELVESCKDIVRNEAAPSPFIAFVMHGLTILKNPLHCLYGKSNVFLTKGPSWRADRIPLVHDILQEEPELDDAYYGELSWLFGYLLDSLKRPGDVVSFHNTRLFEKCLTLASNPYMRQNLRMGILRILWRATEIEGGSTTLVTRFGVFAWLQARIATAEDDAIRDVYKGLLAQVWKTCDREKVASWGAREPIEAGIKVKRYVA